MKQARWGAKQPKYWFQRYIQRKNVQPEQLYEIGKFLAGISQSCSC